MGASLADERLTVIGGAGFIGSHLVERLLADHRVIDVIDDLSTGSLANLAVARDVARASEIALSIHNLDAVADETASLLAMRPPSVVYMLAGLPPATAPPTVAARALERMVAVFDAARRAGVPKVVTALPASVLYGQPAARDLPVKEGTIAPRGVRGAVARAVIDTLEWYRSTHDVEFTVAALATVYGPRQRAGVVPTLLAAARAGEAPSIAGDGRQTRDLVYVDDVVDALARAAHRGGGLVINVGTGVQTTILDLWETVAGNTGGSPVFVPEPSDALGRFAVSPVRARIHLEWSPWTSVAAGVELLRAATPASPA
jgi:UDP-glucose 4-epimerase